MKYVLNMCETAWEPLDGVHEIWHWRILWTVKPLQSSFSLDMLNHDFTWKPTAYLTNCSSDRKMKHTMYVCYNFLKIFNSFLNTVVLWVKKRKYLKDNINELATSSKNKNIRDLYRGINEFKKGYKLTT
jgi:hypothetical protein